MKQPPAEIIACAQNCQKQYKLWASLQLAQWALESAWGTKCTGKFNFFGIKAKTGTISWTHEYIDGKYVAIQQIFANYNSPQDAFDAHAELLVDPEGNFTKALMHIGNLYDYIAAISLPNKPAYATDPNYANNLIRLIEGNQLDQYDIVEKENV